MSQCTCIKDKEMTCIVHPTTRSLKDYSTEQAAEIKRLREALESLREECTNAGGHAEDYINALKKAEAALEAS